MGKTQSRIGGSDRAIRSRIDRHQQPVENDAQPPGLGQATRDRKVPRLAPSRKQLVDTVKLIAYRADGVGCDCARGAGPNGRRSQPAAQSVCSEADLLPDLEQRVLRVQVHPMSNPRANREIAHLLEHLNAAEFTYPGTKLQLVYSIAGEAETPNSVPQQNPTDQEV